VITAGTNWPGRLTKNDPLPQHWPWGGGLPAGANYGAVAENQLSNLPAKMFHGVLVSGLVRVDITCLRCGENWQDQEMSPRPFEPGWRKKSVEAAKRLYRRERGNGHGKQQNGQDQV